MLHDKDGVIKYFYWDFGDGEYGSGAYHAYKYPGKYPVTLKVTDDDGDIGVATIYITILVKPCDVSAPVYGSLGSCPYKLADGDYCVPNCNYGYKVEGQFYCNNSKLTSEAKCVAQACKVDSPAYGGLGMCPAYLPHGKSCVPTCDYGYGVQGKFYCDNGKLTSEAKCVVQTCKVDAPAYGGLGMCPAYLPHGKDCVPTCDYGYEVQGKFSCDYGKRPAKPSALSRLARWMPLPTALSECAPFICPMAKIASPRATTATKCKASSPATTAN
eukprot:g79913.t1